MRCGIVPDYFTVVPLIIVFAIALVTREWNIILSSAIVTAPFAVAALISKGSAWAGATSSWSPGRRGVDLPVAVLAFACACVVAVGVTLVRKRKGEPIAFAPYLAGAIGAALACAKLVVPSTFNAFP